VIVDWTITTCAANDRLLAAMPPAVPVFASQRCSPSGNFGYSTPGSAGNEASDADIPHRVHDDMESAFTLSGIRTRGGAVRWHCRFAVVRTEDNLEIESGEDLQHGHDP
jgi:hypothetical protein